MSHGTTEVRSVLSNCGAYDAFQAFVGASRRYSDGGHFRCADLARLGQDDLPQCDLAIAIGVLHHLDHAGARDLLPVLCKRLAPGGRRDASGYLRRITYTHAILECTK